MQSFMDHIPQRYHEALRDAIDAVTETRILLDQVLARFGTREATELRERMGQTFDGVTVTEAAVAELERLQELHEERRRVCRELMDRAAQGLPLDDLPVAPPPDESA